MASRTTCATSSRYGIPDKSFDQAAKSPRACAPGASAESHIGLFFRVSAIPLTGWERFAPPKSTPPFGFRSASTHPIYASMTDASNDASTATLARCLLLSERPGCSRLSQSPVPLQGSTGGPRCSPGCLPDARSPCSEHGTPHRSALWGRQRRS